MTDMTVAVFGKRRTEVTEVVYAIEYHYRDRDNYDTYDFYDEWFTLDKEYAVERIAELNRAIFERKTRQSEPEIKRIKAANRQGKIEHDALVDAGLRKGPFRAANVPDAPMFDTRGWYEYYSLGELDLQERPTDD